MSCCHQLRKSSTRRRACRQFRCDGPQKQPAEPAHSPVERVTKKARDPKRWRPGVQALPPGKNDCSNSFRRPRNHYDHQSAQVTTTARLLLKRQRSRQNAQTNGQNITITGSHGACLAGVHLRISLRAKSARTCACAPVPRLWRQAPRPKSRINLPN